LKLKELIKPFYKKNRRIMQLTPSLILGLIFVYFVTLIGIALYTSRGSSNESFFISNRKSPWWLIAIGMIGTSISGVTFISVPGFVNAKSMSYMQMVFGFMVGYIVIANILLPMYYKLNLISIYTYLDKRFGKTAYKTGSFFFILSRTLGSSIRLFLMAKVLHEFVIFPLFGIDFWVTVFVTIALIWSYTFKGGVKTIIWTDTLQTLFLVGSLILTLYLIGNTISETHGSIFNTVFNDSRSKMFFFEGGWGDSKNFFKQFLGGASIALVMSGLDQDIMQKILTVKNLRGAKINMYSYSSMLVLINLMFLSLGILLFVYAQDHSILIPSKNNGGLVNPLALNADTDLLFPTIALKHSPAIIGVLFILGITASSYASADSALTSLTTAFCVDFLGFDKKDVNSDQNAKIRHYVHIGFSALFFILILLYHAFASGQIIQLVYDTATITYGPLLGLFAFGFYTKRQIKDKFSLIVCISSVLISTAIYVYNTQMNQLIFGYKFGFELLIVNGLITFLGLWAISTNQKFDESKLKA
jgi:SSS family transporter